MTISSKTGGAPSSYDGRERATVDMTGRPLALFVWGATHDDVASAWRAGNRSAWVVHGQIVDTVTAVGGTPATADPGALAGRPVAHTGKFYGYVFELYDLRPVDELPYDVVAMADRVPVAVAS